MHNGHRPAASSSPGFTLLEVLMVVLLVGIISSVVILNVGAGGEDRQLREESDRLAALLGQAASEAVMQNQEFGLRVTDNGYTFLCLNEEKQRWGECSDTIFRAREIPDGLELRLLRQGPLKALPEIAESDDAAISSATPREEDRQQRITPDIFLLSSGEASAASIEIRVQEHPELRSEVRIDEIGRVTRAEDEPENHDAG